MVVQGAELGHGDLACDLAALLDERDIVRGAGGYVSSDITERLRLVRGDGREHGDVDRDALRTVRRRRDELRRRLGATVAPLRRRPTGDRAAEDGVAEDRAGLVLALAYPDRLAQARGDGRFRLRNGTGASLPAGDPLVGEQYLAVADLDAAPSRDRTGGGGDEPRIRLAAGLDEADVVAAAGAAIETRSLVHWDTRRDDVRRRRERRVGAIVLAAAEEPAEPGDETRAVLLDRVRATRLGVLRWTAAARTLQGQVAFLRAADGPAGGDDWPHLSDDALLAALDDWLAPHLAGARGRPDLEALDVHALLRAHLGHHRVAAVQRLLPRTITVASGRAVAIDYGDAGPSISVRAQELYGTTTHPTIADGRVPLVVHLLSPAGRPIQVTADLPGFWAGSWGEVRKDMAGRYPKHDWPIDPATATPHTGRRRGGADGPRRGSGRG
jgi:ATP-dependent helicase HrpB